VLTQVKYGSAPPLQLAWQMCRSAFAAAIVGAVLALVVAQILREFKRPNVWGARGVTPMSCAIAFVAGLLIALVV